MSVSKWSRHKIIFIFILYIVGCQASYQLDLVCSWMSLQIFWKRPFFTHLCLSIGVLTQQSICKICHLEILPQPEWYLYRLPYLSHANGKCPKEEKQMSLGQKEDPGQSNLSPWTSYGANTLKVVSKHMKDNKVIWNSQHRLMKGKSLWPSSLLSVTRWPVLWTRDGQWLLCALILAGTPNTMSHSVLTIKSVR